MVPLRKIFESLGAQVEWDDLTRTAIATKGERKVSITIGTNQLIVNDEIIELDVPAKIMNNRTLVPLRAISEAFLCDVLWNDTESLVDIFDLTFINSAKAEYNSDNGINFTYFSDSDLIKKSEDELSVKSGDVSATITREPAENVTINDEYIEEIKKGKVVVFDSMPSEDFPENPFSTGGHYVLICGLTKEGKILVANSGAKGKPDFPGIHLTTKEVLVKAMMDDTFVTDMTWGQLIPVREKVGYVVVG
jgi:hypothetical protein